METFVFGIENIPVSKQDMCVATQTAMRNQKSSPFLSLPAESRLAIYKLVLCDHSLEPIPFSPYKEQACVLAAMPKTKKNENSLLAFPGQLPIGQICYSHTATLDTAPDRSALDLGLSTQPGAPGTCGRRTSVVSGSTTAARNRFDGASRKAEDERRHATMLGPICCHT
ncbi:hypothetical protein OPT61_g3191 [Boeremia exigua]|uniref:Uncharacterized protein n=1 Tax=Boeremia exigua TaxID=749465 RepID=A0ACC2IIP5_9PLEO|nr:hypothetical protein OPT61_g3191 [Boeremia exigua]